MGSLLDRAVAAPGAAEGEITLERVVFERADRAVGHGVMRVQWVFVKADTDRDRIEAELVGFGLAARAGLPVPAIVAFASASDLCIFVLAAVDGATADTAGEPTWTDAGSLIAGLHRSRHPERLGHARYGPADLARFIDAAARSADASGVASAEVIKRARNQLASLVGWAEPLPTAGVHGDLQVDHVLADM